MQSRAVAIRIATSVSAGGDHPFSTILIMAKLGYLGLGLMGYPMARNLLKAGHEVAVWSYTKGKAEKLAAEAGAKPCASPAEAARDAECVFLCVGNTEMAEHVIL